MNKITQGRPLLSGVLFSLKVFLVPILQLHYCRFLEVLMNEVSLENRCHFSCVIGGKSGLLSSSRRSRGRPTEVSLILHGPDRLIPVSHQVLCTRVPPVSRTNPSCVLFVTLHGEAQEDCGWPSALSLMLGTLTGLLNLFNIIKI